MNLSQNLFAVTVGFTTSRKTVKPGETVDVVVEILEGDLQPGETAVVGCISQNGTAIQV